MVKRVLIILAMVLMLLPASAWGGSPIEQMTDDMVLPQEANPHGWYWRTGATISNPFPNGCTAMTSWGNIFEAEEGSQSTNTRVQIRNMRTYLLHADMKWEEVQIGNGFDAGSYSETFGEREEIDRRDESSGGISIKMKPGQYVEFIPAGPRAKVGSDVIAVYVQAEARLIVDSYWKHDDRNQARFVVAMGGDWWRNSYCPYGDGTNNPGIAFSRFKIVTPYWRTFSMTTMVR